MEATHRSTYKEEHEERPKGQGEDEEWLEGNR
jgi:hypothetical protein